MTAPALDWSALQTFKRPFTDPMPPHIEEWLASEGLTAFHGPVEFVSDHVLTVDGVTVEADGVLIASGGRPGSVGHRRRKPAGNQ